MNRKIIRIAFISKISLLVISNITLFLIPQWDNSSDLVISSEESPSRLDWTLMKLLMPFFRWDAVHFHRIALYGYEFEQQHAFFPLLPYMARILAFLCTFLSLFNSLDLIRYCNLGFFSSKITRSLSIINTRISSDSCFRTDYNKCFIFSVFERTL